jgi:transcriptional regulator with XRE-family HTH domain
MGQEPTKGNIALALRRARLNMGWSQRELARRIGRAQARISEMERETGDPRLSTLMKAAAALGMELILVPRHRARSLQRELGEERQEPHGPTRTVFEELVVPDPEDVED